MFKSGSQDGLVLVSLSLQPTMNLVCLIEERNGIKRRTNSQHEL